MISQKPRMYRLINKLPKCLNRAHIKPMCTYRFIVYDKQSRCIRKQLTEPGCYAVTHLIANFGSIVYQERDIEKMMSELEQTNTQFINLRKMAIKSPYAAYDANIIKSILTINGPYNELDMELWTFHSPIHDMWESEKQLVSLSITFNDGIAFPNAMSDILTGLATSQPTLKELQLINNTPHKIVINKNMLPKQAHVYTTRVTIIENTTITNSLQKFLSTTSKFI